MESACDDEQRTAAHEQKLPSLLERLVSLFVLWNVQMLSHKHWLLYYSCLLAAMLHLPVTYVKTIVIHTYKNIQKYIQAGLYHILCI
jgi:hypothetical protein